MAKDATEIDQLKAQLAEMQTLLSALTSAKPVDAGAEAVKLLAQQSAPKDNPNFTEISPFTRADGSRPHLTRPTFFGGARQRDEQLTPDEIEAFNALTASRTARGGTWKAEVRQNGSAAELHVDVPMKTGDEKGSLPSLLLVLMELAGGAKAADPAALAQRVAELERKLELAGAAA